MMVVLTRMSLTTTDNITLKIGSYGVCICEGSIAVTMNTELLINDDFTFHYIDNSNQNKKIDVKGKWKRKGNIIYLLEYKSNFSIHSKWKIDKNEKCLKSRAGLNFRRLCHINSCK
jgi:hypothetical protein